MASKKPQKLSNTEAQKTEKDSNAGEVQVSLTPTATVKSRLSMRAPNFDLLTKPTTEFTKALASEIVKNLTTLGKFSQSFRRKKPETNTSKDTLGEHPVLVDTSVLIDGRIVPIVNSGFFAGTLIVPHFVLGEVQHIADSSDALRRAKGRRGLEVVNKLKGQKVNERVKTKVINEEVDGVVEVDHKLVALAKRWRIKLLTLDFNLAQLARASGVKILNINDLAQAVKIAVMPGEEIELKITHEGKERLQGVGYLEDGTMVVVEDTRDRVGQAVGVVITKVHQTPAGQLFFGRLK